MPYAQVSNLDFLEIKTALKDYLRAQGEFTDFDFDGSVWSNLLDVLAYLCGEDLVVEADHARSADAKPFALDGAALDAFHQVFGADFVSTSSGCCSCFKSPRS